MYTFVIVVALLVITKCAVILSASMCFSVRYPLVKLKGRKFGQPDPDPKFRTNVNGL